MWVTRRKDMIRMKLLTGVLQREPLKTVDTGVMREDGSPVQEIEHTPKVIETAEQNLERQTNEWYTENIVAEDQILERVHYFVALPGGIVHFLAIHYDDGIGNDVEVVK